MPQASTYTIAEAAALTGLHRNTIRMRIKLGQLQATVRPGKFGDEYRISHSALVAAGLLAVEGPLGDADTAPGSDFLSPEVLDAEVVDPDEASDFSRESTTSHAGADEGREDADEHPGSDTTTTPVAALAELYQRHEQAMFRLGYLQGELERLKALAATAESLREEGEERASRVRELESALARETERAAEADRQRNEAERLRRELSAAQDRLQGMESLRADLDALKEQVRTTPSERPWWRFW